MKRQLFGLVLVLCACRTTSAPREALVRTASSEVRAAPRPLRAGRCREDEPARDRSKYLAREPIRAVMQRAHPQVRGCYDGLVSRGRAEGVRVVVSLTIEQDGSVSCSDVTSQLGGDDAFGACVADAMLPLRFASHPRGRIRVSYPFAVHVEGP
ncbi:MAG: AgmX/PglI C-terminal domain-containing protein [Myxococcales bacterium]|nr:AgmX/PglI C-terminal domain-containing protein [Myxococcales bacterium]